MGRVLIEEYKVGKYEYVYGAGNSPNRKIHFYGNGEHMWGEVYMKVNGCWEKIGEVPESCMTKEEASTTEKVNIMMEAREKSISPEYPPDKSFDEIPYSARTEVIKNLSPTGSYRISMISDIVSSPFFETVKKLTFFDPS